jgi:hypothetical protein
MDQIIDFVAANGHLLLSRRIVHISLLFQKSIVFVRTTIHCRKFCFGGTIAVAHFWIATAVSPSFQPSIAGKVGVGLSGGAVACRIVLLLLWVSGVDFTAVGGGGIVSKINWLWGSKP